MPNVEVIALGLGVTAGALYLLNQLHFVKETNNDAPAALSRSANSNVLVEQTKYGIDPTLLVTYGQQKSSNPRANHLLNVKMPNNRDVNAHQNALLSNVVYDFQLHDTLVNQAEGSVYVPSRNELNQYQWINYSA